MPIQEEPEQTFSPDPSHLRGAAVRDMQRGLERLHEYHSKRRRAGGAGGNTNADFEADAMGILREGLKYFLGPAGEICDACGGSGRKR